MTTTKIHIGTHAYSAKVKDLLQRAESLQGKGESAGALALSSIAQGYYTLATLEMLERQEQEQESLQELLIDSANRPNVALHNLAQEYSSFVNGPVPVQPVSINSSVEDDLETLAGFRGLKPGSPVKIAYGNAVAIMYSVWPNEEVARLKKGPSVPDPLKAMETIAKNNDLIVQKTQKMRDKD